MLAERPPPTTTVPSTWCPAPLQPSLPPTPTAHHPSPLYVVQPPTDPAYELVPVNRQPARLVPVYPSESYRW